MFNPFNMTKDMKGMEKMVGKACLGEIHERVWFC